jgi:hypothetical protein
MLMIVYGLIGLMAICRVGRMDRSLASVPGGQAMMAQWLAGFPAPCRSPLGNLSTLPARW